MIPEAVADVLYSKEERVFQFTDEAGEKAIEHLRGCSDCQSWFRSIIPEEIIERNERASHYCCMSMYCAMEEYGEMDIPRISFRMYRGEDPLWCINGKMMSAFRFCPWCAKPMPDKPFTE